MRLAAVCQRLFGVRLPFLLLACGAVVLAASAMTIATHPKPDADGVPISPAEWSIAAEQGLALTEDSVGTLVVLFCNPGCGFCHQQVRSLAALGASGVDLRVRVRFLGVQSMADTAGLGALFRCNAETGGSSRCDFAGLDMSYLMTESATAKQLGIVASPTLLFNGRKYAGTRTVGALRRILREGLGTTP